MESTDQQPIDINLIKKADEVMELINKTLKEPPTHNKTNYYYKPKCCNSYYTRPITANSYFGKYNNNSPSKD